MNQAELYRKIYEKYGKEKCILLVVEELSELTKELCKNADRGFDNRNEILDEFSDVLNVLTYLQVIYNISDAELAEYKTKKYTEQIIPKVMEQL